MSTAFLGVGSNLGDRRENIEKALELLRNNGLTVKKISSVIETDPVGGPPQGKFLNAALEVETDLNPFELLSELKSIEKKIGRKKTVANGPRIIDLDILLYDDIKIDSPELTIPHPRMLERDFVMIPLKEIKNGAIKTYAKS